jgi:hypothetical protein
MLTPELIYGLLGALAMFVAQKLGLPINPSPAPLPVPPLPTTPVPDKEASDFLAWVLKVKSGTVRLDDQDKEILKLIKAALEGVQ